MQAPVTVSSNLGGLQLPQALCSPSGPPCNVDPSFSEYLTAGAPLKLVAEQLEAPALQFMRMTSRKRNSTLADALAHPTSASSSHDSSRASPFNNLQPSSGGLRVLPVPPQMPGSGPLFLGPDSSNLATNNQQMVNMWSGITPGVPGHMANPAEVGMKLEPNMPGAYCAGMADAPNSQPISAEHHTAAVEPNTKHRRTVSSPSIWDAQQNALNCAALGAGLPPITDVPSTGGYATGSSLNSSPLLAGPQPQVTSGGFNNSHPGAGPMMVMPPVPGPLRQPGSPSVSTSHQGSQPNTGPLDAYASDPGPHSGTTTTTTAGKQMSAGQAKDGGNVAPAAVEVVQELLAEIPANLQPVVLAKVTQKGRGGRQPAADPRDVNPNMDPRQVRRILANRQSAARSKMKQRVMLETLRINKEVLTAQQDCVKEEVTRLTKLVEQLQARNQELEGQLQAANLKQHQQQLQLLQVQQLQVQQQQLQQQQMQQEQLLMLQRQRRQAVISNNGSAAQGNNWQLLSMQGRVPAVAPAPTPTSLPTDIGWAAPSAQRCDMRSATSLDLFEDLDKWWDGPMDM